ncbi:hypothetical protein STVIR_5477 [Streptomyces viridochromogenes Tue57]|uniref:Uncharacterized protein n=1 Tax=Streptomyces viridochromogenes Tue57 TaxID=1160705 RepID=L8PDY2_STRVR|nr:hypothetical protein STVIR_5477 [Streptomyces viridochromogenes Tue57]
MLLYATCSRFIRIRTFHTLHRPRSPEHIVPS